MNVTLDADWINRNMPSYGDAKLNQLGQMTGYPSDLGAIVAAARNRITTLVAEIAATADKQAELDTLTALVAMCEEQKAARQLEREAAQQAPAKVGK